MKNFIAMLIMICGFSSIAIAQDGLYIGGRKMTERELEKTRRHVEEMKRDLNENYYIYNGDDRLYIGRGLPPRTFNYNQRQNQDILSACSGLSERKYRRCVDDAIEARQKLIKKYRN